jgi:hypothetical protein
MRRGQLSIVSSLSPDVPAQSDRMNLEMAAQYVGATGLPTTAEYIAGCCGRLTPA